MGAALMSAAPVTSVMAAAPVEPMAGSYLGYEYFVSSTCATHPGVPGASDRPLVIYWPGAAAMGFHMSGPAIDAQSINVDYLPVTPAVGVTSWSGFRERDNYPDGTKARESFSGTITYISSTFFLIAMTSSELCADGSRGTATSDITLIAR
jgi:hypothetical protein